RTGRAAVAYPPAVERALAAIAPLLPEAPIAGRALGLMVLAGDETLVPWLRQRMASEDMARVEEARDHLRRETAEPVPLAIARARHAAVARTAAGLVEHGHAASRTPAMRAKLEVLATHPVWGVPVLLAVLAACYLFVGVFGAKTLVDLLEQGLFGRYVSPAATAFCARFVPWAPVRDLLVGPYGLVTMALAYSVALVLPIVGTFFVAFGVIEDSGYLPRLAVMVNRL